ncbi:Hsp70 family protein [Dactylosporangium cerinum]|uniref:Hsp70 family protein n=1 Tax=Dactylosporangium cerinum TaxID=1434730 RepID=A0ABV9VPT4_9ACTN
MPPDLQLSVDYGSSNTVAVIVDKSGSRQVLFDGSPLLPSAVFAERDGTLSVGRDAVRRARLDPARYEPSAKRRVDEQVLLLGDREVPVRDLIAATLSRVAAEATRIAGGLWSQVVLTCPAAWGATRRLVLLDAAEQAGLGEVKLVEEPVAAAWYFAGPGQHPVPTGSAVVVYDFGAGTFDASVVARTSDGFTVLATDGRADLGGLDLDAALITRIGEMAEKVDTTAWARLTHPVTAEQLRYRHQLWDDVRGAKERLSSHPSADVLVPLVETETHVTREEFEDLIRPMLEQTIRVTQGVVRWSKLQQQDIVGVFLVGGSSRVPLAATMLHRALGVAPTVLAQPELVVAQGAVVGEQLGGRRADIPLAPATVASQPQHPALSPAGVAMPTSAPPVDFAGTRQPAPSRAEPDTGAAEPPTGPRSADRASAAAAPPDTADIAEQTVRPVRWQSPTLAGWLARLGTVSLILGLALPWASYEPAQDPPFSLTMVAMSLWPGLLGAVVLVATVLGLSWTTDVRRRLTARLVAFVSGLAFTIGCFSLPMDQNSLSEIVDVWSQEDIRSGARAIIISRPVVFLAIAGVWLLVLTPWAGRPRSALFGTGLVWSAADTGRRAAKRVLAAAAVALAVANVVILWFRGGVDNGKMSVFSASDSLATSWAFVLASFVLIAVMADLAITGEAGDHQRWVNPARAFVLAGYALVAGEGSGYLYWFDLNDLELSPWVTVAPLLFAVLASFVPPRAEPSRG